MEVEWLERPSSFFFSFFLFLSSFFLLAFLLLGSVFQIFKCVCGVWAESLRGWEEKERTKLGCFLVLQRILLLPFFVVWPRMALGGVFLLYFIFFLLILLQSPRLIKCTSLLHTIWLSLLSFHVSLWNEIKIFPSLLLLSFGRPIDAFLASLRCNIRDLRWFSSVLARTQNSLGQCFICECTQ